MDYERILAKKQELNLIMPEINAYTLSSYEKDFELTFTHNSTAIEGNTLTIMETKLVLEDGLSVGGKHLREIYEVVNHRKAYRFVKQCIKDGKLLDEECVKDIHAILSENIFAGGFYRNEAVRISGAGFTPPVGNEMYFQIKEFYNSLETIENLNPIELSAWTHAEFVRIHPFIDGNGRTARLIMNFQLMRNGFLPVSISKERRLEYYNALESYATEKRLESFADLIAELEEIQLDEYLKLKQTEI